MTFANVSVTYKIPVDVTAILEGEAKNGGGFPEFPAVPA